MAGGRRGLVAPQNTFLENIIRRSSQQRKLYFFFWSCFSGKAGPEKSRKQDKKCKSDVKNPSHSHITFHFLYFLDFSRPDFKKNVIFEKEKFFPLGVPSLNNDLLFVLWYQNDIYRLSILSYCLKIGFNV